MTGNVHLLIELSASNNSYSIQKLISAKNDWKFNIIYENYSHLDEDLSSKDTCWHLLRRVHITIHRTRSFQCSSSHWGTSSKLQTHCQIKTGLVYFVDIGNVVILYTKLPLITNFHNVFIDKVTVSKPLFIMQPKSQLSYQLSTIIVGNNTVVILYTV